MFSRLALALVLGAGTASAGPTLTYSGQVTLETEVGGLSGIELSQDGSTGLIASDRGQLFKVGIARKDGRLSRIEMSPWAKPATLEGDLEGVATLDGKTFFFSFEEDTRVVMLSPNGQITTLNKHPAFQTFEKNKSLEAVAIRSDGTLFTLPENPSNRSNIYPLFAYQNHNWQIVSGLPRRGSFMTVGADFGPDGLFYILERTVSPFGFRSRVRRFNLNVQGLDEQVLLATLPSKHGNLEGISVWRDSAGQTRVTMVSDNNFLSALRSEIVEYILQE
jgi:hypothetical protein